MLPKERLRRAEGARDCDARVRIGMVRAYRLLADRQRAFEEGARAREIALVLKQAGEVVEIDRRTWMLGAERLLIDRQRALKQRPRVGEEALHLEQESEVIQAGRCRGCSGRAPSRGSPARVRGAVARLRGALGLKKEGEVVEARRGIAMLGPSASSRIARARSKSGRAPTSRSGPEEGGRGC